MAVVSGKEGYKEMLNTDLIYIRYTAGGGGEASLVFIGKC